MFEQNFTSFPGYQRSMRNNNSSKNSLESPISNEYFFKLHYIIDKAIYRYKYKTKQKLEKDIEKNTMDTDIVVNTLLQNIHTISDLSKRNGFTFIFYLQPNIYYTNKKLSDYENKLVESYENNLIGYPEYNRKIYSIYKEILLDDANNNKYYFIDGDKAFENEEKTTFVDHVHFGDRGNSLIAEHIFYELKQIMFTE